MATGPLARFKLHAGFFWRRFRAFLGKGFVFEKQILVERQPESVSDPEPIFLLGTWRSGTSVLRRIVDSHPDVACPPESYFLAHYAELIRDENTFIGLYGMGYTEQEARRLLSLQASYFHRSYMQSKGKTRWADKYPGYVFNLDALDELFLRRSRFVFIFRFPMDVAFSIWKRGWHSRRYTGDRFVDVCKLVRETLELQLDFAAHQPDRCHLLFYEELLSDPRMVLKKMFAFVGCQFDENVLSWWKSPHDVGTEDPVVKGSRGWRVSSGNWRAWNEEQQQRAFEILAPLITGLGYVQDGRIRPNHGKSMSYGA